MSGFIDTTGNSTLAIGICGRCSLKFPLGDLMEDPNSPGLLVCQYDVDDYDPYRLPPRETEQITLTMPRPDVELFPTVTVAPGTPQWPTSTLPGGQGAAQLPTNGNSS
jgi:hypothetical protein